MILAGLSKTQVFDGIKAAFAKKELPTAEPGSMCYMMSKEAYLNDRGRHDLAHLMSEVPRMDFLVPEDVPEPTTEFIVRVEKWSDGTPAPTDTH
jgi:hypothetical protein